MSLLSGKTKASNGKSTQSLLRITEVRDDTIVMDDGTLRAVLAVSSTNFDLKSQDEQNAIIYGYQRFLNSLDFPIQIVMQSRKMEISDYLEKVKQMMERQTNELLRIQTAEYVEFIGRLVESANIMNKSFYVVVPLTQSISPSSGGGLLSGLFGGGQTKRISEREQNFTNYRKQLDERAGSVSSNLGGLGLRVVRLTTAQLIELLYNSYNFAAGPLINAQQLDNITISEAAIS
jgi:hypothetical protein